MKASELIDQLEILIEDHGDQEIIIDSSRGLWGIGEVDIGGSDEGIVIWAEDLVDW